MSWAGRKPTALTWVCDCCGVTHDVDVSESYALGANLPLTLPVNWSSDADGLVYCPGAYCQQAQRMTLGDEPERQGDTRDSL